MPSSIENRELTVENTSRKGKKFPKILVVILCVIFLILLIELAYVYTKFSLPSLGLKSVNKSLSTSKIAGYDTRLGKYYLSEKKFTMDEVINIAKKNCLEVESSKELTDKSFKENLAYMINLREKFLLSIGLKPEEEKGLLFVREKVPDTNICWVIWAVDNKGRGVAGYENKDGKIETFSSTLPKSRMDEVLKNIKI